MWLTQRVNLPMIPIYKPYLNNKIISFADDALDSSWISSQGKYISMVEERLKNFLQVRHVLLTNNGTSAMHLVAKVLRYKNPARHNIIVPNNVYVAAWNAFLMEDGFKLNTVDADIETWNFDVYTKETYMMHWSNAILAVHNLGNPVNVPLLKRLYPDTPIVEDACEAFGAFYEGRPVGSESLCAGLSFYGNKNITSGEGGAFITNDDEAYEKARLWWGQGQSNKKFIHSELGYNYRMTNVQAALIFGQLLEYPKIQEMKRTVFDAYTAYFSNNDYVFPQLRTPDTVPSDWMFGIRVIGGNYDDAVDFLAHRGIETRPMFYPINRHAYLSHIRGKMDVAELLAKECIVLPSYPELTLDEIRKIVEAVNDYTRTL